MNRTCVQNTIVDDSHTYAYVVQFHVQAYRDGRYPMCTTPPVGVFSDIARIHRVYYTMYYMPHVRTYARAYKLTACYDMDRPRFPMKFHRCNSGKETIEER